MTSLRNIAHDLVEKKLWPVAAVLLLVLVALPFLISGGGEPDPAGIDAVATPGALTSPDGPVEPAVVPASEDDAETPERERGTRDPFRQKYVQKAVDAVTAGGAATTPDPSPSPSPSTGGAEPAPAPAAPSSPSPDASPAPSTPSQPTTRPVASRDVHRVTVRFGSKAGRRTVRDVARLSPLPSVNRPFFVYGGVLDGGEKAVFLAGVSAPAGGEGTCRPAKDACYMVELGEGESHRFVVPTRGGGVTSYRLDVISIRDERATSARAAAQERESTDEKGAELVDAIDAGPAASLGDVYRYSTKDGVLERRSAKARGASGAGERLTAQERIAAIIIEALD